MYIRPRRNRKTPAIRALISENTLTASDFIYPLFIHEGHEDQDIESMPGCKRWSLDGMLKEAGEAYALGVHAVLLFPAIGEKLKTPSAEEAWNPDGLVPTAVRALKEVHPDLCVITDVALDPYNSEGHDGLVEVQADGSLKILNDPTVLALCQQALCHAEAGADMVSPSDMMDGRVAAIRGELDDAGYQDVSILSYSAKYASAFYGPFRGALDSAPKAGDKKTYQMDPANAREAIREVGLDEGEGADMVMVKPAGPYLDVNARVRESTALDVAAYQVSGEYLMIESAAASGWIDGRAVALESLMGIKRAGADLILTYYAKRAAEWLRK